MRTRTAFQSLDVPSLFIRGAVAGVVAGIVFAVAQVVAAMLQGLPASTPLQVIAGFLLGPETLTADRLSPAMVSTAIAVHLVLSAVYGMILGVLAMAIFAVGGSVVGAVFAGMAWGFVLWLINFFLIAPMAFPWLTQVNQAVQFVLHVVFFGAPLGYYLGRTFTHSGEEAD